MTRGAGNSSPLLWGDLMSKQDGVAVRSAADLERKYQFGKRFAEIMGIANDARGSVSKLESEIIGEYGDVKTAIRRTAANVTIEALADYTTTDGVKEYLSSQLSASATEIRGEVSKEIGDRIQDANDKIDGEYGSIKKCFAFDLNGLAICAFDGDGNQSPNKVVIDNDDITIYVNNVPVQQFKADGTSFIPVLNVTDQFNVCGLSVTKDLTHINIDFVG